MTKTRRSKRPIVTYEHTDHKLHEWYIEITYNGLHEWYVEMFEKLGWMILAHKNGWHDKIMRYKDTVNHLEDAILHKRAHTKEADRKKDLKIMLENVKVLKEHIHKDFI